jgi:hypothetical protein
MKLTTIFGSAIAIVGLAACGSTVAPTVSPTLALTVVPTPTATPIATPSASESPSPSASPSPSPTEGACGYAPCASGSGYTTTCAVAGTAQGGSVTVTFTAGAGQTAPVLPASVTIDGHVIPVTSNPFTFGPLSVGVHTFNLSINGLLTIPACDVVTVRTTCSTSGDTGTATFTGVTVGDKLVVADIVADYIPSNPYAFPVGAAGPYTYTESSGGSTVATGSFTIAACVAPKPATSMPGTGARLG